MKDIELIKQEPSLPSNLDEAAEEHSKQVFYGMLIVDNIDAFKAGAEWMAGQGVTARVSIDEFSCGLYNLCVEAGLTSEDDVIVQIRKA